MSIGVALRKFGRSVTITALIIGGALVLVKLGERLFNITSIEVAGEGVAVALDQSRLPKNLLFFPTEKVTSELLRQNPLLDSLLIQKKFPHTLVIKATKRAPVARLATTDHTLVIASGGVVVGIDDRTKLLPVLQFESQTVAIGQSITDKKVLAAVAFAQRVGAITPLDSITSYDSLSLRATSGKTDILFTQDSDVENLASTLQMLFTGFKIKGTIPTMIDLRFDKPIVKF